MFKRLFIGRAYVGAPLAMVFVLLEGHAGICRAQETDKSVQPQTFSGGILNRKAIEKPNPTYPLEAREARASGAVVVEILVDENGKVQQAKAVSGHPLLRQAAVDAAYEARFAPTRVSGNPVKVSGKLVYRFLRVRSKVV